VISLIGALEYSQCADLKMLDAVFACRLISDTIDINHKVLNEICKRQWGGGVTEMHRDGHGESQR
jgi:hypothetical protein